MSLIPQLLHAAWIDLVFGITRSRDWRWWPLPLSPRATIRRMRAWSTGVLITFLGTLLISFLPSSPTLQAQACPAKQILFVGSSAPLAARDESLRTYLSALGHNVTVRAAAAVQAADADGKELVIISESSESVEVNTKLRHVTAPLVTWEAWLQDELGMTGASEASDYGEDLRQQTIRIVNPNHPLAGSLSGVVTTVSNNRAKFHWGAPNGNATMIAVDPANSQHARIYAYEQGVQMVGMAAPARRVFIHNATGTALTAGGWQLFEAAVNWAMGCTGATTPPTPTATATYTYTPTPTATPTVSPTLPSLTATAVTTAQPTLTPTLTPTVTPTATPTLAPKLSIQKQDLLFVDADEDGFASQGDTLLYIVDIQNAAPARVTALMLEDIPDANTKLIAGTVRTGQGTVVIGNQSSDTYVIINVGDLAPQQATRILFQVQIQAGTTITRVANQAQVRYASGDPSGQGQQFSDDPDTAATTDVTFTLLGDPATQQPENLYLPMIAK